MGICLKEFSIIFRGLLTRISEIHTLKMNEGGDIVFSPQVYSQKSWQQCPLFYFNVCGLRGSANESLTIVNGSEIVLYQIKERPEQGIYKKIKSPGVAIHALVNQTTILFFKT